MLISLLAAAAAAAAVNWATVPPVPGGCAEPASANLGKPGCFLAGEVSIAVAPAQVWWHIHSFPNRAAAQQASSGHRWATITEDHGDIWLFVLGAPDVRIVGGIQRARIGPLPLPMGQPLTAKYVSGDFPPGMRTRVHRHPGTEAFYVVDGEQCVETPTARLKLGPGDTFILPPVPHIQAAPKGRRNFGLVFYPPGEPWMSMLDTWTPSQFCAG